MEDKSKELITILSNLKGYDIDATLQHDTKEEAGFNFMSYVKAAIIHVGVGLVTVSEPVTAKYFCLPLKGIKEIHQESGGDQDIAFI